MTENQLSTLTRVSSAVDVIVPVYRGLLETLACIHSVLNAKAANKTPHRLIVIDDKSPEPDLSAALQALAREHDFILLHNTENLGFVKTVNRGMQQHSENDVVLLNSDAEVAGNWLDKLRGHLQNTHLSPVATVTPFSNNATICSYPIFLAKNPLPAGEDIAHLSDLAAFANTGEAIEIPTAVGFCMYITRQALDTVGLFDAETFGKGYGEENDFCARAIKAGFHHAFALDTFVAHEGGVSFLSEQVPLQAHASQALLQKHPEYDAWVRDHVFHDPARQARVRLDLLRFAFSPLPLILNVLHVHGGGTAMHVEDLALQLYGEANVLALKPLDTGGWLLFAPHPNEHLSLTFSAHQLPELLRLLQLLRISRVHYQHVLGLPDALLYFAGDAQIAYDVTAHDFYFLSENPHPRGKTLTADNAHMARFMPFLQAAQRRFVPSLASQQVFATHLPNLPFVALAHPDRIIDVPDRLRDISSTDSGGNDVVSSTDSGGKNHKTRKKQILLLGALSSEKGADVLEKAIEQVRQNKLPIHFHLLGYSYQGLRTGQGLSVYGAYAQKDLAALIDNIDPDWVWFPSQAPETYSYTLSAAMAAERNILASDLGAFSERLAHYPRARVLPFDTTIDAWLAAMLQSTVDAQDPSHAKAAAFDNADYLNAIPARQTMPDRTEAALLTDFAMFESHAKPWRPKLNWADTKIVLLKTLVWLKRQPWLAKLLQKIPLGLQLKIKNYLVGNQNGKST